LCYDFSSQTYLNYDLILQLPPLEGAAFAVVCAHNRAQSHWGKLPDLLLNQII
jgi:hypothetical protein